MNRSDFPDCEFPHCNSDVLHAPGTCVYCDMYPEKQAVRAAGGTPFTPPESNGWHGNVAQTQADVDEQQKYWDKALGQYRCLEPNHPASHVELKQVRKYKARWVLRR